MLDIKKMAVIALFACDLGTITTDFEKYATEMDMINMIVEHGQKTALFGAARALKLVLGC